jgi:hypothetical protein
MELNPSFTYKHIFNFMGVGWSMRFDRNMVVNYLTSIV